jgi:arylsulfatase A-like enzyme/Tfp pilus assembly protein PilF
VRQVRRWFGLIAILVGAWLAVPGGAALPLNVVLITLDTVRADHLGSYGYAIASTPALDRLAREGARFSDATTHAPLTGPAHAGILTGVYPARFGIRDNASTPLPKDAVTLASVLQASGYRTGAFIGAFILDRAYGFDRGFDTFDSRFDRFQAGDKLQAERPAGDVVQPALAWLSSLPASKPFFAWVHLYDAHAPYAPPEPYRTRFRAHPYDGEVAYVDSAVGRILAMLQQKGRLDRTLIVAIGDHGESLGEHGEQEHGLFLYDAVLRIPLLMRLPGTIRGGMVVRDQVRAIDVMPTILSLVGVASPPRLDGESLAPLLEGHARATSPLAYAETYYPQLHFGWSPLLSARVPEWKYISAPRAELYDLRHDPREASNALDRQQNVAGRLDADLRQVAGSFGVNASSTRAAMPDAETMARLRSLGYVGFTPSAPAGRGADPKDMVPRLEEFRRLLHEATEELKRRQPAAAVEKLKQAAALNERAYDVHLQLGDAYAEMKDVERALGEYEAAALLNPASADPLVAAAKVCTASGRLDEAQKKVDQAARLEPRSAELAIARGRLDEQQGKLPQALEDYREAVRLNPSDMRARASVVNIALRVSKFDVAETELKTMLAANFDPARTHYALGIVAEGRGDRAAAAREYRAALHADPGLTPARTALSRLSRPR